MPLIGGARAGMWYSTSSTMCWTLWLRSAGATRSWIIDAMDLLYAHRFDGFCLVSSDSDFTRLAVRIRGPGSSCTGLGIAKLLRHLSPPATGLFTSRTSSLTRYTKRNTSRHTQRCTQRCTQRYTQWYTTRHATRNTRNYTHRRLPRFLRPKYASASQVSQDSQLVARLRAAVEAPGGPVRSYPSSRARASRSSSGRAR